VKINAERFDNYTQKQNLKRRKYGCCLQSRRLRSNTVFETHLDQGPDPRGYTGLEVHLALGTKFTMLRKMSYSSV